MWYVVFAGLFLLNPEVPVTVEMHSAVSQVRIGDSLGFRMVVRNRSVFTQDIRLPLDYLFANVGFVVVGPDGHERSFWNGNYCGSRLCMPDLHPGMTVTAYATLFPRPEALPFKSGPSGSNLFGTAGKWMVRGWVEVNGREVYSQPILIDVLPRTPDSEAALAEYRNLYAHDANQPNKPPPTVQHLERLKSRLAGSTAATQIEITLAARNFDEAVTPETRRQRWLEWEQLRARQSVVNRDTMDTTAVYVLLDQDDIDAAAVRLEKIPTGSLLVELLGYRVQSRQEKRAKDAKR